MGLGRWGIIVGLGHRRLMNQDRIKKNGSTAQGNSGEELFEVADVNSFHFHLG